MADRRKFPAAGPVTPSSRCHPSFSSICLWIATALPAALNGGEDIKTVPYDAG
jgi:hypothetical protein